MDTLFPSRELRRIPKRLLLSYVFDWIVVILIAIVGGLFTKFSPNHRPFSLTDPTISFPYVVHDKISTLTLVLVALVAPAIILALVCLIFVPGPTVSASTPKSLLWRRKLWEWQTAWLGLALALASAFFFTDAMKSLFGKPRPDLLSRCDPDLANIQRYVVGGFGSRVAGGIELVSWKICRQSDLSILNDGFVSFPSGHSSFAWAGLTYLTLFLCSKLAITIPYLLPAAYSSSAFPDPQNLPNGHQEATTIYHPKTNAIHTQSEPSLRKVLRSQAAAPPTYLVVIASIPICIAVYIISTRYSDFKHHGFDIISGSLMGFLLAWGSFRLYHAPIRRGAGWSWGPRNVQKAWSIGIGVQGYGDDDLIKVDRDIESGA